MYNNKHTDRSAVVTRSSYSLCSTDVSVAADRYVGVVTNHYKRTVIIVHYTRTVVQLLWLTIVTAMQSIFLFVIKVAIKYSFLSCIKTIKSIKHKTHFPYLRKIIKNNMKNYCETYFYILFYILFFQYIYVLYYIIVLLIFRCMYKILL